MKIAVLGAAGVRTPLIVRAMAGRARLELDELALMDTDGDRLEIIAALTDSLAGRLPFQVIRTTDAAVALRDADFVITTFRVGGIESRIIDERVPLSLGVLGQETTGPGGFAMGLRTLPVLFDYLSMMETLCPDAWLINFANPAGMLAEAAVRAGWRRTVGICDAPSGMTRMGARLLNIPAEDIHLDYFGLNHLGWIRAAYYRGQNLLPQFFDPESEMGRQALPGLPFDRDFLRSLGMVPNEYLYYYYHARQAVQNILTAGETRGEQVAALNRALFDQLGGLRARNNPHGMLAAYRNYLDARQRTYMTGETGMSHALPGEDVIADEEHGYAGVALDLIESLNGAGSRRMILNVANRGSITGMDAQDVVEVPAIVGEDYVQPLAVGEAPSHCLGLMLVVKAFEQLTIQAALENSYEAALHALTIHPLVQDVGLARRILDGYITEHAGIFPALS
jgi:6-phospho-beta-glucosidase